MTYTRRVVDDLLDELLPHLPAIALEGAKAVGKTMTATQRSASSFVLDDQRQRELLAADPGRLATAAAPVLLDEWQLLPAVWDQVRRAVDAGAPGGSYLLTGSAAVAPGARIHSGAGRIVSLRMRPLAMSERGLAEPTVSLRQLLTGDQPDITGTSGVSVEHYTDEILRSGFPGIRNLPESVRPFQLDGYLSHIVERELPENDRQVRRPAALMDWLRAYGAATSSSAAYSTLLDAATAGMSDKPARQTIAEYREALLRLFVLDPVPGWTPAFTPLKRLAQAPKHHLVDPALSARLTGTTKPALLKGEGTRLTGTRGTWLGALFESLATQSVRVYAEAVRARVSHLRSRDTNRQIDLIVEGEDQRVVGIEVKLAATVSDGDVRHLNWLATQLGDRLADRVVITTGPYAYRRKDGVAVVPLALLGP